MANTVTDGAPGHGELPQRALNRSNSISQASENSQTAQEFISSQLQLEAEAREALPYQFDTCTRPLGPLRQLLFSCLTCNPPPESPDTPYTPAGVCYSCSISCHGEHTLVELFNKRNFVCDCGTTRLPSTAPCTLRVDENTGEKGNVHSEQPAEDNRYNQNFRNRFCGCAEDYDAHQEKGTMFQCIGLGTVEDGGCGEDWWHPECIVGLPRGWYKKDTATSKEPVRAETNGESNGDGVVSGDAEMLDQINDDPPLPPGFPDEDDFEQFICYKCTEAFPWIKRYAGAEGFLPAMFYRPQQSVPEATAPQPNIEAPKPDTASTEPAPSSDAAAALPSESRKRKASPDTLEPPADTTIKRQRSAEPDSSSNQLPSTTATPCKCTALPPAPSDPLSLFTTPDFRLHICHCPSCFPLLTPLPQLLEIEETYEPPLSASSQGSHSAGTKSLLDRGEAALSNIDRVRAIEGVMVYNHLKDKVKGFLKPFAESGKAVGAEDIKKYFEGLRGEGEIMRMMREGLMKGGGEGSGSGSASGGGGEGSGEGGAGGSGSDNRREQGGY